MGRSVSGTSRRPAGGTESAPSGAPSLGAMFGKKKKRVEISAPSNFEHRVHTGFDQHEQKFTGLPRQWQSLIEESARRPKPLVDPGCITSIQPGAPKVWQCPPRQGPQHFTAHLTPTSRQTHPPPPGAPALHPTLDPDFQTDTPNPAP